MPTDSKTSSSYQVFLLTLGHFLSDFYSNFLPALLPVVLSSLGVSLTAGGYIGDRLGRKQSIIYSLAVCLPAMYYLIAVNEISPLTWIALAISGAALQGTIPSSVVWAQNMIPDNAAMASGMMMGLSFGLGGLGTALTGAAADIVGLKTAMLWTLVPLAAAIPLTCWIPEKKQENLEASHITEANS